MKNTILKLAAMLTLSTPIYADSACLPNLIGEMPDVSGECTSINVELKALVFGSQQFLDLKTQLESVPSEQIIVGSEISFLEINETIYSYVAVSKEVCGMMPCADPAVQIGSIVGVIKATVSGFEIEGMYFSPVAELPSL